MKPWDVEFIMTEAFDYLTTEDGDFLINDNSILKTTYSLRTKP